MQYTVRLQPNAEKSLNKLQEKDQTKIKRILYELSSNPFIGKKLKGDLDGNYTVRSWPYRIVYKIIKKELIIIVVKIGHRQGVY